VPLRPRELLPRERDAVPRDLDAPLDRDDAGFALALRVPAALRVPVVLRAPLVLAPVERLAADPEDFARVDAAFLAPVERDEVEREVFAAPEVERLAVERVPEALRVPVERAPLLRDDVDERPELPVLREPELAPLLDESLVLHLPLITRCAASATASAMSEPSLVALDMTLLAARSAVSAASRPASRIFLRAAGLALIAAAAAARPAASISLLIAALASLSTRLSLEREPEDDELERDFELLDREELLRADFAIFYLPPSRERHFRAVPVP